MTGEERTASGRRDASSKVAPRSPAARSGAAKRSTPKSSRAESASVLASPAKAVESRSPEIPLEEFVARTELIGVRVTHLAGRLLVDDPDVVDVAETLRLRVNSDSEVFQSERFQCCYRVSAVLVNGASEEIASIEVEIVASFGMLDDSGIDADYLPGFIKHVGYVIVFPFAREAIQTLTLRLGLEPVTLGLLHQDRDMPASVSFGHGTYKRRAT